MTKQPSYIIGNEQSVEQISAVLQDAIGSHLIAFYILDQPTADGINALLVIESHDDLHQIRQGLRPYLKNTSFKPLTATKSALPRHLKLDAHFAQQLGQSGRLISGKSIEVDGTPVSSPQAIGLMARFAIDASSVLAPSLLKAWEFESASQKLNDLAAYLGTKALGRLVNPIQTIAAIQGQLAEIVDDNPENKLSTPAPTGAPPIIDALVAIYERQERAIFILPDWPAEEIEAYINSVDWAAVSESLLGQYSGLQLSTPTQFRLMVESDKTADFYLQNYVHAWGINVLANLDVPHKRIYRDLACFASTHEVQDLPQDYLKASDDQINKLVHDYQNKLLNIQLREELMHRLINLERAIPPGPLPGREAPNNEKVAAIFDQFAWWADHYTALKNAL